MFIYKVSGRPDQSRKQHCGSTQTQVLTAAAKRSFRPVVRDHPLDCLACHHVAATQAAMSSKARDRTQFAALPCRIGENRRPQVLLLTSRETRRWVIPKGWPIKGLKPHEVATREAFEEAGLKGTITGKHPIGAYHYEKQLPGEPLLCEVRVFLFWVTRQLDHWPERDQRETRWFELADAAALVDEGGLAELVRTAFKPSLRPPPHHARNRRAKSLLPQRLR